MELNPREKKMLQSPVDEAKYFYVWTLVRDVAHLLEKARDRELRPHGITVMQATVLHMIRMLGEEATPVALARVMFREAPTISSVLGRLEEQGLILKKRQGRRGGAIWLTLTPEGEAALADTLKRDSIRRVMSGLDAADCQNLVAALLPLRRLALRELGLSPDGPYFSNLGDL